MDLGLVEINLDEFGWIFYGFRWIWIGLGSFEMVWIGLDSFEMVWISLDSFEMIWIVLK